MILRSITIIVTITMVLLVGTVVVGDNQNTSVRYGRVLAPAVR